MHASPPLETQGQSHLLQASPPKLPAIRTASTPVPLSGDRLGGKVAAWLGALAVGDAALAALFAQVSGEPLHTLSIAPVIIAGVAFVGLLLTGPRALWVAWRGRGRSTGGPAPELLASRTPKTTGVDEVAKELARIAKDQEHDRKRPVLEGRILPWPGRTDGRDHRLEVRVKTH
jgi:hypothetical protein